MNRRSLLRLLPMAPAAAQAAAQQVVVQAVATGSVMHTLDAAVPTMPGHYDDVGPYGKAHNAIMEMMGSGKIPEWKMVDIRRLAKKRAVLIDQDLLAMQSISMSAKRSIQVRREIEKIIVETLDEEKSRLGWDLIVRSFIGR